MTHANPFLYLQHSADVNPRGVFSRSADQTLTNAEAVVAVKKLAFELRRLGVRPGHVVALHLPDHLSILFTEAVYHEAGVSTVIPRGVNADGILAVDWVFTSDATAQQGTARVVTVDRRFLQQVEENPYGISPREDPVDTLRIVFSSGTTGTPKAIALGRAMEQALDASLQSWFHGGPSMTLMDTGTVWGIGEFFLSVKAGQPYLCVGGASADTIIRFAREGGVRMLKGSPQQLAAVVDALHARGETLPTIETIVAAGTVLPPTLADFARQAFEGCVVLVNYGSTEAGGATTKVYDSANPFNVGHPNPGSEIEIVDEHDVVISEGEVGRVRLRSRGMVTEYVGDREATALAFRDGWFYPGDVGFLSSDGLTLTGRESELLNAGGVKVDPNLLDHVALRHPGISDASSFAYDNALGVKQIGLAVVANDLSDLDGLAERMRVEFSAASPSVIARVDLIPRTNTGKPNRRALAERFREH